jgi:MFS family permease
MSVATLPHRAPGRSALDGLWHRGLDHYPPFARRMGYLAIVVTTTILLYWQLYITSAIGTRLLTELHMSFLYFTAALAVGNAVGAFSALAAGLADRWGRANLVAYGVGLSALITLVGFPLVQTKLEYGIMFSVLGIVEGVILVATPALIRDFSPQVGRASAMGFWTIGPVVGSLMVTLAANTTLSHYDTWQSQYVICGIVSVVVFGVALLFLRELEPELRGQLMVSPRDRELIELRARAGRVDTETRAGYRGVLRPRIIGAAVGISTFLVVYYTLVAFTVLFFALGWGFTESQANHLGSWYWGTQIAVLIGVGLLSDRLSVRKPFMLLGALGSIVMTVVLLAQLTHDRSFDTIRLIVIGLSAFQGIAFATWMAGYTETVEREHPALVAHGLAIWGWVIRIIVCALFLLVPHVVHGVNTVADAPPQAALQAQGAALLKEKATLEHKGAALKVAGAGLKADAAALGASATPAELATLKSRQVALERASAVLQRQAASLKARGTAFQARVAKLEKAAADVPRGWRTWLWIAAAGQLLFVPLIFALRGRWRPSAAKRDIRRYEDSMERELAELKAKFA